MEAILNFDELKSRDVKDLRVLAAQYSIKTFPRQKAETIAKLIVEHITAKPVHGQAQDALKHPAEKPTTKPLVIHSEEEIRDVIKPFLAKDGYTASFLGDDTVMFRFKGAEECIHMSSDLRTIRMKAESVSRGARRMVTVKNADGHDVMMAGV